MLRRVTPPRAANYSFERRALHRRPEVQPDDDKGTGRLQLVEDRLQSDGNRLNA